MNYRKHYIKLIRNAQNRKIDGYVEKHHIFPKSIFGKNNNLVSLTAKEHYIAHYLLWKDFEKRYGNKNRKTQKMLNAFWQMSNRSRKTTSKVYAKNRIKMSEYLSLLLKGKPLGPCSQERKDKMRLTMQGKNTYIRSPALIEKYINAKRITMKSIERVDMFTGEVKEYESINSARRDGFDQSSIIKCCKNYINSYKKHFWKYKED